MSSISRIAALRGERDIGRPARLRRMHGSSNTQGKQRATCRGSPESPLCRQEGSSARNIPMPALASPAGPGRRLWRQPNHCKLRSRMWETTAGTSWGSPQLRGVLHALGRHVERRRHLRGKGMGRAAGLMTQRGGSRGAAPRRSSVRCATVYQRLALRAA